MTADIRNLVPADKHDIDAVNAAISAGYPAVEPILPDLLEWVQDMNWPVAQPLASFLATLGKTLIPHVTKLFESDDVIWKAYIVSNIVNESPDLAAEFRCYLETVVSTISKDEDEEWLRESAADVLAK